MRLSDCSVERGIKTNRRFISGIRRLATERQEVRRGVKSGFFVSSPCNTTLAWSSSPISIARSSNVHLFC